MREFVRRLIVPVACFLLALSAGYPMLESAQTAPSEAGGTGIVLLALAAVLRRVRMPKPSIRPSVGDLVPQTAGRGK